jgi:hypothetical protein
MTAISSPRTYIHFFQHEKGNSSCPRFSTRQRRPSLCPLASPLWAPRQRLPPATTPNTTRATRIRRLRRHRIPGRQNGLALDSDGAGPIGTTNRVRPAIDRYVLSGLCSLQTTLIVSAILFFRRHYSRGVGVVSIPTVGHLEGIEAESARGRREPLLAAATTGAPAPAASYKSSAIRTSSLSLLAAETCNSLDGQAFQPIELKTRYSCPSRRKLLTSLNPSLT